MLKEIDRPNTNVLGLLMPVRSVRLLTLIHWSADLNDRAGFVYCTQRVPSGSAEERREESRQRLLSYLTGAGELGRREAGADA